MTGRAIGKNGGIAFGQQSGPPASGRQVRDLLALLQEAGHSDFRDARGPMGFTQRQAGGKFTRDEATAFIEQLEAGESNEGGSGVTEPVVKISVKEQLLRGIPDQMLAAELQRRGWVVMEP